MTVVACVPIKLANQRLPGKNVKPLGGKPLLQWALESLVCVQDMELLDAIYVYCSDPAIVGYLPDGVRYKPRNESLNHPSVNGCDIYRAFLADEKDADLLVLHHATSPFVKPESIAACIQAVKSGKHDSACCVEEFQGRFWRAGSPCFHEPDSVGRTQDMVSVYHEAESVYVFPRYLIETYSRRIGFRPHFQVISHEEAIDIDEQTDFDFAEIVARGMSTADKGRSGSE